MKKIIIEVGSTNTKIDIYDGKSVKRLDELTILFKQNYKLNNKIDENDIDSLIFKIKELQKEYNDFYICGTSIFRNLEGIEKDKFLNDFYSQTGLEFHIISAEEENELTVIGATSSVDTRACVFVGGGGSTEISIYDNGIVESKNTPIGVMDIMEVFPDLDNDIASTSLEDVMNYIEERLEVPNEKCDYLILAGGEHELFARESGIRYEENTLYQDNNAPIMMDINTRIKETERYFEEISLDAIKKRVSNPDWWRATRAMCAFVLVIAKKIDAKYIIPTNISMVYGILEQKKES